MNAASHATTSSYIAMEQYNNDNPAWLAAMLGCAERDDDTARNKQGVTSS